MAFLEFNYYSKALSKRTVVNIILPEAKKTQPGIGLGDKEGYKTLYLFHGLSQNHADWMRRSSIERYADKYGIAVVMPNVDRSWYSNTAYGVNYFTFVTEELPEVCRGYFKGMSDKREDNFVAGLSMGGYGALKVALTYPEKFGGCVSLSGSLDITRKNRPVNLPEWKSIFDFNMESPLELEGSEHDLYALARKNQKGFPKMYIWCGTEDDPGLLESNRKLHRVLDELNVEHTYKESEGDHSWPWWDLHIQDGLKFLFEE
ncbi:MAG: esterase family protein [Clostridia bacterium]|nr:esterase family protein [Clostridia bacterium]